MPRAKKSVEGEEEQVEEGAEGTEEADAVPEKVSAITYHLRSGKTRTFSEAEHGEDFEAVAAEFESNNASETHAERKASCIDNILKKKVS